MILDIRRLFVEAFVQRYFIKLQMRVKIYSVQRPVTPRTRFHGENQYVKNFARNELTQQISFRENIFRFASVIFIAKAERVGNSMQWNHP